MALKLDKWRISLSDAYLSSAIKMTCIFKRTQAYMFMGTTGAPAANTHSMSAAISTVYSNSAYVTVFAITTEKKMQHDR